MPNLVIIRIAATTALLATCSFAYSESTVVASLAVIDGTAIVSEGARYVTGAEGIPLKTGDRIMVLEGGKATIRFSDNCVYELTDEEILDIVAMSTCERGAGGAYQTDPAQPESVATDTTGGSVVSGSEPGASTGSVTGAAGTGSTTIAGTTLPTAAGITITGASLPAITAAGILGGAAISGVFKRHGTDEPLEPLSE